MDTAFLYTFGYEDPDEREANQRVGTDFEGSREIIIMAANADEALDWGREVSEWFVVQLFGDPSISWKRDGFAHWVELVSGTNLEERRRVIPIIKAGDYPPFDNLE